MSGHTPGPWVAMRGTESTGRHVPDWAVSVRDGATWICTGPEWDVEYQPESFANARLIAAAPELLEALVEMTALAEGPTGGVTVAMKRDVIAKARAALARVTP